MAASRFAVVGNSGGAAIGTGDYYFLIGYEAPSSQRVRLLEWGVYGAGTSPTNEPIKVVLARYTTTASGQTNISSGTLTPLDPDIGHSARGSAFYVSTSSGMADGDAGTVTIVKELRVHPTSGYEKTELPGILIPASAKIGLFVNVPNAVTLNSWLHLEE